MSVRRVKAGEKGKAFSLNLSLSPPLTLCAGFAAVRLGQRKAGEKYIYYIYF